MALHGQYINKGSQLYRFTERLLTDDTKVNIDQAAMDDDIWTVDNFNRELAEITKHAFPR